MPCSYASGPQRFGAIVTAWQAPLEPGCLFKPFHLARSACKSAFIQPDRQPDSPGKQSSKPAATNKQTAEENKPSQPAIKVKEQAHKQTNNQANNQANVCRQARKHMARSIPQLLLGAPRKAHSETSAQRSGAPSGR